MDVVRDVLDKSVVDRNGREMGRVDGILLDGQPDQPIRLAAIVIGPAALGDRLHPALGRFVRRVEKWFGVDQNRPTQIDFADIDDIGTKSGYVSRSAKPPWMPSKGVCGPGFVRLPGAR